jgi:hypothetical protein
MKSIPLKVCLTFIIIQFLCLTPNSVAQNVKFGKMGEGEEYYNSVISALGKQGENYYSIYTDLKGKIFLEKTDKNLNLVWSKNIMKIQAQAFSYGHVFNNYLYVFYGEYQTSKSNLVLHCQVFDLEGKEVSTMPLGEVDYKGADRYGWVKVLAEKSADNNSVAILVQVSVDRNQKSNSTFLTVDMNDLSNSKLVKIEQEHPVKQSSEIRDLVVSNTGQPYAIMRYFTSSNSTRNNDWLLTVDEQGKGVFKALEYKETNFWYSSIALDEERDELNIAGLYVEKAAEEDNKYQGFYFAKYDAESLELKTLSSKPLDAELMTFLDAKFKTNRNEFQFMGYYNPQVFPSSNGSGYIVFEHDNTIYSTDFFVLDYNAEGEISNRRLIPKYKFTTKNHGNSYFGFVRNNSLFVVYNDAVINLPAKNMDELSSARSPTGENVVAVVVEVKPGEVIPSKKVLFITLVREGKSIEIEGFFLPTKAIMINDDVFFGITYKKGKAFGLITP